MAVTYTDADKVSDRIQADWAKAVVLSSDSGVSQANKDEIYVANTAPFSVGDNVRVTDNTEQTGEDLVVSAITADTHLTVSTNMTKDYTTALSGKVQIKSTFSNRSRPSKTAVENLINEAEDWIDKETNHAWRTVTVTREHHDIDASYVNLTGVPINLIHRTITAISSPTDKIEVWDGSNWIDWAATKTEGRESDFWLDYEDGVIFLRLWYIPYRIFSTRVTYRFGESSVPKDIQRAATLLAAADVLDMENFVAQLPTAGDLNIIETTAKQRQWRDIARKIILSHRELLFL